MSLPKLLGFTGLVVFSLIFGIAFFKGGKKGGEPTQPLSELKGEKTKKAPVEIALTAEVPTPVPTPTPLPVPSPAPKPDPVVVKKSEPVKALPEADRIEDLFQKGKSPLKFVETITYKSRVPWLKGRPAWLSDYAAHYETSRHYIARSLNSKPDYFKQDIAEGDKINVLKKGVDLKFLLVVDTSLCKLWLYAIDDTHKETTLLKTYPVSLGRIDTSKPSGYLTPTGRYSLGSRIAIYKPKVMGYYKGKKIEMVKEFGSRWIPFDKEIAEASAPAKGYGIHGVPWVEKTKGTLTQDKSSLGKYESDGCIRLSTEDIEEIFAIIITKPSEIEIVSHFEDASIHKR
ncbi:MAG: L,D-transpeptidase [Chlamydiia bacterium]|nr:L,D-transpeptidase [Chlamydiia bacterium]